MSYIPQRTFNGTQGNPSVDSMGPEQISNDIDQLCKMFDKTAVHGDGQPGGIHPENMDFSGLDINALGGVASTTIKAIRINERGEFEMTADGVNWITISPDMTVYATKEYVNEAIQYAIGGRPIGNPTDFTLEAANWNGTTYTLVTTSADYNENIGALTTGLSAASTAANAEALIDAGITLPYFTQRTVQVPVEGQEDAEDPETEAQQEITMYFSAIYTPTVDIVLAVYGLKNE